MSNKKEDVPNTYEWKVEDIKAFKEAKNVQEFKSPFFELHGFRWCLRVFPNGSTKAKKENVNCFLWLRSLPPKYSKIAVNITMTLQELDITASFPHQFTDKAVTRGWVTGTLKTADLQNLKSLTFTAEITVHDIYGRNGNLISHIGDDEKDADPDSDAAVPIFSRQSSELMFDKQNIHSSRLDSLSLKIEELNVKIENMQNAMDNMSDKQDENDENFNSIVNEMQNIKKHLGDEYKSDEIELNQQNTKVKIWLENECQMGMYFKLFVQNGIDNMDIAKLINMDHLEKMGVDKIGHRIQISHKIDALNQQIQQK